MRLLDGHAILLGRPCIEVFDSYIQALQEGFFRGNQNPATPEDIQEILQNPKEFIESLCACKTEEEVTPSGKLVHMVPYEILWLHAGNTFIGEVSFRFELSPLLEDFGGHIGYGIRPSFQRRGMGCLALEMICERARSRGMDRLLVTCSPDNIASERIILANGGLYEDTRDNSHWGYDTVKRFWIELTS